MNRVKSAGIYILPLFFVLATVALWTLILKPLTIRFIAAQLPTVNSSQNIASVEVEKFDLSILKLQLMAQGVTVKFKKDLSDQPPLVVDYLSAQLDIFDLIVGHINLSKVVIDTAQWSFNLAPEAAKSKTPLPLGDIFKLLEVVPIDRLIVYNSGLQVTFTENKNRFKVQIPQLTIQNKRSELLLTTNNFSSEFAKNGEDAITFESDFSVTLKKNELSINKLELRLLSSHFGLTAKFTDLANILDAPEGQIKFRGQVNLEDVRTVSLSLFPQKTRISSVMGHLDASGELNLKSTDEMNGSVDINTSQVVWDHFKLGQAKIRATLRDNEIEIKEVNLEHPSGSASLKNVKIGKKPPYSFSTSLEVKNFDLQKLFASLGLTHIPAGLLGSGKSYCSGFVKPEPEARCKVEADLTDIWVKTSLKDGFNILKLKKGNISGETIITKAGLSYQTNLLIGTSKGVSSGTLDFQEGFDIKFDSQHLSFTDIESLAERKISGDLKISGSTRGDAGSGSIKAAIAMHNAEIDDFFLGDFEAGLEYRNSNLRFDLVKGKLGNTPYAGDLLFNFTKKSELEGEFRLPDFRGDDVLRVISKKFSLPFNVTGAGKGDIRFKGPFDFWKLSFDLRAQLKNGTLAGESFNLLDLNIEADGQNIVFKNVRLKKIKSEFLLTGSIDTTQKEPAFNLKIRANPLLLEESDRIIAYAPAIAGIGYAEGQITGPIALPEINLNFTLNQVSYDKVDYPNSQGKIRINKNFLNFNGQFFGRQIQSDITWPWNPQDNFSAKILIHNLNPLFLLPLVSIPQPGTDFTSRLNAEIDLTSKNRSLASADGYIKITEFLLQRGSQNLKLERPSSLIFKSGLSQMENINLSGNDSFLSVKMNQNTTNQVRLTVKTDLQLRLLHFLVPFAQTISGNFVADTQVILKENSFELLGEGELTDGNISMKGFPQSIENLNTPIEFSKSKVFLSDITGQFGQSDVTGIGQIEILGAKNIQVNLRAVADSIELNFPNQISTGGKATVFFTGNWLPYTLKIDYAVSHGLVEKDFEAGSNQTLTLKASSFLPQKQFEQLSPSLALDVTVDLSRGVIIKNKLIEGEAVGLLNITGSPETPIIRGKIDIKPGSKLIFKDKPFNIQTASINFQQAKEINPDIYISGNARISDYDINLLVQGPAKNLSIKPTSQPPLSEADLFSLLALGVTSQTDHNLSSETQQKQTGLEVLAAISNQSQLNKKIQEKLGLTVQLAPSVDSTKNIAVPKVVVSKKLSEKFNASYSKPFTGNDQNQEIKLQYLYNNNVSLLLNYQNKDTIQQDQISNTNSNTKGILGIDLEYRDEFK